MTQDSFFTLKIFGVLEEQEDILVSDLFDLGCAGVYEDLPLPDQANLYGESWNQNIVEVYPKIIKAHFATVPAKLVEEVSLKYPNLTFDIAQEAAKDWNAEWKKGFKAFEFIPGYWVQPTWESEKLAGKVIKIDPGMAFGTGTHATTQLAGRLILKSLDLKAHKYFLEIGTGTGILAFLAAKMGAPSVSVTENDPEAIRVLNENALLNSINFQQVVLADFPKRALKESEYNFVVANIIQTVLEKLKTEITQLCAPGGLLVLSGVLSEDSRDFIKNWLNDFDLLENTEQDEWSAFLLKRKSNVD